MIETTLLVTTAVSISAALIMGAVTWRVIRQERLRSLARVDALRSALDDGVPSSPAMDRPIVAAPLFRSQPIVNRGPSRLGIALAVACSVAVLAFLLPVTRSPGRATVVEPSLAPASRAAAGAAPLELVSLNHELDGKELHVQGVVRNPVPGSRLDDLAAVVFVFDEQGGFLESGRAAVPIPAPGTQSPFAVTVDGTGIGRYRISFRSGDRILPHVDRRGLAPGSNP